MIEVDVRKRSLGVNFDVAEGASIVVWAPEAKSVEVLVSGLDARIPLEKDDVGYWRVSSEMVKPGDLYKFVINGGEPLPDPASLAQPHGVHGFSQALDLNNFSWSDQEWNCAPLEELIIYELHTGTFSPSGTFEGIAEKVDYLLSLGINAIEIMPVAQFPGSRNWGYDGVFPFAVQDSYGGAGGLQKLVDLCHQKGMAVVLDVVYNHLGPEGNYFAQYAPYFTDKYNTPWGNAVNFDDEWSDGVRRYFIENALMWFRDFHIDALRLDAVHAIKDFSAVHILREIKLRVDELKAVTGRKHYLIVELDLNDNRFINPLTEQGYGMDAQWIDEFHHALRVSAGGETTGYYSDFTGIGQLAKAYKDAYVYDGIYSPHRKKTFGIKAENNPGKQFIVFSQNHDQVGNRMLGERISQLASFEMQKLLAGAVMVSPYIPMLFMGEEWGEPNPFLYFVSHSDPDLAEAVRKGRKAEFAAFHAEGEAPDPVDEQTFQQSKLQWDLLETEPHRTLLSYYKKLIQLRKQLPALRVLSRSDLEVDVNEQKQTLTLRRRHGSQEICCLMNFSKTTTAGSVPDSFSVWKKVFDSAEPKWKGPAASADHLESGASVTLQPESILIYSNQHE